MCDNSISPVGKLKKRTAAQSFMPVAHVVRQVTSSLRYNDVTLLYVASQCTQELLGALILLISFTLDQGWRRFYQFEIILSHIPMHTRSNDPYVSSLSEKSVQHRYLYEISITNTR